jgi:amino acid adenylation domain-containing protein
MQAGFEQRAIERPDAPAVTCGDATWSYRELNDRAERLAQLVRQQGAHPETVVGVCVDRSVELLGAMLGVMKADAAYVALEPGDTTERLAAIIDDAQPLLVLADERNASRLQRPSVPIVRVDDGILSCGGATAAGKTHAGSRHLAYVTYPPSEADVPVGVMVENRNVTHFFTAMDAVIGPDPGVWLAVGSPAHDISILEIWWALSRGFHVVLWPGGDPGSALELIARHGVTHMHTTRPLLGALLAQPGGAEALAGLRVQVVTRDSAGHGVVDPERPRPSRVICLYGVPEATAVSTAYEIGPGDERAAIGWPVADTEAFVFDRRMRPVPVGVVGELCIGGSGVARGYVGRSDLTGERFVQHPFGSTENARLFRTGRLARYRCDGILELGNGTMHDAATRRPRLHLKDIAAELRILPGPRPAAPDVQLHHEPDPVGSGLHPAHCVPAVGADAVGGANESGFRPDPAAETPPLPTRAVPVKAVIETGQASQPEAPAAMGATASLVVALRTEGAKPPLFLIHGDGGYVFLYRPLAAHFSDRPVYGVRAEMPSERLGHAFFRAATLEQLAAQYIAEIQAVHPGGPYGLGGACFGGVVAFEMARQLRASGHEVGPVLLFDAFVWNNPTSGRDTGAAGGASAVSMVAAAVPAEVAMAFRAVYRRAAKAALVLDEWRRSAALRARLDPTSAMRLRLARCTSTAGRLLSRYTPGVYDGRLVLFTPPESGDCRRLWLGLARGGLIAHEMPGSHLDMLEEPAVAATAALIREYLDGEVDVGRSSLVVGR